MHVDQNRVFFLFLCQLSLFHSFLPRAPEGVLLIRAVSPTTPQGSVSQLDSLIHIHRTQVQRHIFTKSGLLQHVHTHPYAYHLAHTHTHTLTHSFILLPFWHLIPEGEQLKDAPFSPSPPLLNPLQLHMSPLPEVASLSHPVSHRTVKLAGDMMIEMPQTCGRMALVKWNA